MKSLCYSIKDRIDSRNWKVQQSISNNWIGKHSFSSMSFRSLVAYYVSNKGQKAAAFSSDSFTIKHQPQAPH